MAGFLHYQYLKKSNSYWITAGYHCPKCSKTILGNGRFPEKELTICECEHCKWKGTFEKTIRTHQDDWAMDLILTNRKKQRIEKLNNIEFDKQ